MDERFAALREEILAARAAEKEKRKEAEKLPADERAEKAIRELLGNRK